jgi:hypothetical protein
MASCGLNVGPFSASFTNCALATTNISLAILLARYDFLVSLAI